MMWQARTRKKAELQEIVEFLKNPQKFVQIGARIPKGVLLVGLRAPVNPDRACGCRRGGRTVPVYFGFGLR